MSISFYKQQVGIATVNDGKTQVDILDVQTNAQLQLPNPSVLMKTCWSAIVPLSNTNSKVQLVLQQDTQDDSVVISPEYTVDTVNQSSFTTDNTSYYQQCVGKPNHKCPFLLLSGEPVISGVIKFTFLYI